MQRFKITKYPPTNPSLKGLVKYFWAMESDFRASLHHKLLPVSNIDMVLNLSSPMTYVAGDKTEEAPKFSISGIRRRYCELHQEGRLKTLGVAFFPAGVYPLLKTPLCEYADLTVDLEIALPGFNSRLGDRLCPDGDGVEQLAMIEDYLAQTVDPRFSMEKRTHRLVNAFYTDTEALKIGCFCDRYGVHPRKFERIFQKYIGTSPKAFKKIDRFQVVLNQMLHVNRTDFTTLAHDHDYFDQAHLIKDFKAFTGSSPGRFIKEKKSIKQIM